MIVADINLIASLWVPNRMEELAYTTLKNDPEWIAPFLWKSELRNVLTLYLRKKIMDLPTVTQTMEEAENLMKNSEYAVNSVQVLSLVSQSSCSSYDCEFVALAGDLNLHLVTFDRKLIREFPDVALHPEDFQ